MMHPPANNQLFQDGVQSRLGCISRRPLIVISGASGFVGRRLAVRAAEACPIPRLICYVTHNDSAYESQGKTALTSRNLAPIETDLPTVYGPECRPDTVLSVLKKAVLRRSLPARVPWPGKTGFIHVDDLVTVLLAVAELPPPNGQTATYLVQGETRSLADLSRLIHARLDVPFRPVELSERAWRLIRKMCSLALRLKPCVPSDIYAAWWRLRIASENVFWCDTAKLRSVLPG